MHLLAESLFQAVSDYQIRCLPQALGKHLPYCSRSADRELPTAGPAYTTLCFTSVITKVSPWAV